MKMGAGIAIIALLAGGGTARRLPLDRVYQHTTKSYDVELDMDPALKAFARLYARLRAGVLIDFADFEAQAMQFHDLAGGLPAVSHASFTLVLATPHLIAVSVEQRTQRPGAPPEAKVEGYLFDRASGQRLALTSLLRSDTDMARLNAVLQHAVTTAKRRRHHGAPPSEPYEFKAPTWGEHAANGRGRSGLPGDATLVAGDTAGRAAGLQFLYSPYRVRSFEDGAYRVVVPLDAFVKALRPEYAVDFGGAPLDMTDDPLQGTS